MAKSARTLQITAIKKRAHSALRRIARKPTLWDRACLAVSAIFADRLIEHFIPASSHWLRIALWILFPLLLAFHTVWSPLIRNQWKGRRNVKSLIPIAEVTAILALLFGFQYWLGVAYPANKDEILAARQRSEILASQKREESSIDRLDKAIRILVVEYDLREKLKKKYPWGWRILYSTRDDPVPATREMTWSPEQILYRDDDKRLHRIEINWEGVRFKVHEDYQFRVAGKPVGQVAHDVIEIFLPEAKTPWGSSEKGVSVHFNRGIGVLHAAGGKFLGSPIYVYYENAALLSDALVAIVGVTPPPGVKRLSEISKEPTEEAPVFPPGAIESALNQ